ILDDVHPAHELHVLERPRDAEPRDLPGREAADFAPLQGDAAATCRKYARDQIEGRTLSCAVGSDQPDDLSRVEREIDLIDRAKSAEGLRKIFGAHQLASGHRLHT